MGNYNNTISYWWEIMYPKSMYKKIIDAGEFKQGYTQDIEMYILEAAEGYPIKFCISMRSDTNKVSFRQNDLSKLREIIFHLSKMYYNIVSRKGSKESMVDFTDMFIEDLKKKMS